MNVNEIYGAKGNEYRKCAKSGKIMYSKREAGIVINGIKGHKTSSHLYRGDSKPQRMYYCEYCGAYHVTHYVNQMKNKNKKSSKIKMTYGKGFDAENYEEYSRYF